MTKAFPWGFKDVDIETRDAARAAARRSGKSLGDWLDDVIHEKAEADLRRRMEDDDDDGFGEAPRRFETSRRPRRLSRERGRWRRDASIRSDRLRDDEALDAETIVGDAVAIFERRAAESERKTAKALAGLAELIEKSQTPPRLADDLGPLVDRLRRIESWMERQAGAETAQPIRSALERLETRIEQLSREDRAVEFETALEGLDRRLAEIAERLDHEAEERRRLPAPAEQRRAPGEPNDDGIFSASAGAFGEIRDSIEALSHRLEAVRHEANERGVYQSAVSMQIERLRHELEGVSQALVDLAPRASATAVEAALRDLAERVETQRDFGIRENVLAPVERLTADLHSIIRELDPSRIVHDLYDEVKTIGDKLAARAIGGGADQAALSELAGQTREIRDLLKAVAARPLPLEKLEAGLAALARRVDELRLAGQGVADAMSLGKQVEAIRSIVAAETPRTFEPFERKLEGLSTKIDAVLEKSGGGERFDEINERIDRVHESLAARIDRGGAGVDTSQLEHLVTSLARRIDTALDPKAAHPAFDELGRKIEKLEERLRPQGRAEPARPDDVEQFRKLAQRIDLVRSELAARIDDGARADNSSAQLAELVGQLAQKMDAALDPHADRAALSSLEQQIERLSERLDRSDESIASFVSIERTIGELFERIEDARDANARAAELAARQAAQDALRAASAPGALQNALEKEIGDLRNVQDESSQRTHQTLAAVHETLERVVDRLSVFENELADLRKAPPAAAPAHSKDVGGPRREAWTKNAASSTLDREEALPAPGARRSARQDQEIEAGPAPEAEHSVQADFIAAARRAAQQAAVEARAAVQAHDNGRIVSAVERRRDEIPPAKEAQSVGAAIQARKRPLLLGLGALVMLIGAYQIARVSVDLPNQGTASVHGEGGEAAKPGSAQQAQSDVASAPSAAEEPSRPGASSLSQTFAGPPTQSSASPGAGFVPPLAAPMAAKTGNETVDPTPVGSIGPAATSPGGAPDVVATIQELATAGDPAAQFELALRYAEGRGLARDSKAAFQWFEKAAGRGLAPAQYRLGALYEKGVGVDRDYARAREWYRRAARAGNARAMHNLAVLHAEGGEGKPDYVSAAEWFQKAAELGVRDSQFNLAILYARGLGVGQSFIKSYLWFSAAAAQGDEDAAKKRDEVGARLDSKELAAARALVDAFKPREPDKASNDVAPPQHGGRENVKAPAKPEGKPAGKPKVSSL